MVVSRKKRAETMARECEACGKLWGDHKFREFLVCQMEGWPLKDGGTFDETTADAMVKNIKRGLKD